MNGKDKHAYGRNCEWARAARSIERGLQAYPGDSEMSRAPGEVLAELGSAPVQVP